MDYRQYYFDNKNSILKLLYSLGYTPHNLILESGKDGIDVFEYIYILYSI